MTSRQSRDFPARVFFKHNSNMSRDSCVFKFLQRIVDGKHFMRLRSENAVSKFLRRRVDEAWNCVHIFPKDKRTWCIPPFWPLLTKMKNPVILRSAWPLSLLHKDIGNSDHSILSGTVISPGSIQLRAKDIKSRLLASKATCIIADSESAEFVDEVTSYCCSFRVTPRRIACKNSNKSPLNLLSATASRAWSILNPGWYLKPTVTLIRSKAVFRRFES